MRGLTEQNSIRRLQETGEPEARIPEEDGRNREGKLDLVKEFTHHLTSDGEPTVESFEAEKRHGQVSNVGSSFGWQCGGENGDVGY